ncbi:MAG TPA: CBS domain-containing protein [Longimicrobiales bacterium]|nr:CBS domain-containing protein [Longimicrobiales bacterium]
MRFVDYLDADRILVPLGAPTLEEAIFRLLGLLPDAMFSSVQAREKAARDLAQGERGEVVYLAREVIAVFAEQEGLTRPTVLVGLERDPFTVILKDREDPDQARLLLLFLVPGKASAFRARTAPTLRSFLSREGAPEALLAADSPEAFLATPGLEGVRFPDAAQVAEAMEAARYRVYPESSAEELVDLMIRRKLRAVPVVGEGYEVLGVVTAGDALRHLLARDREGREELTARDIMTRQVLCVSEDQDLKDVAQILVNRGVAQLPVVREGQFVGFITRDSALASLAAVSQDPD